MSKNLLSINNLKVSIKDSEEKEIIKGISLNIKSNEVHCLMGPNGSGKSSLALTLMGHPNYLLKDGSISFDGQDLTKLETHERARAGLFLSFQYPSAVPGVTLESMLRASYNAVKGEQINPLHFRNRILKPILAEMSMPVSFLERYINDGFSGGEKKKAEILQMVVLEPKMIILDETDSGLDVDALKLVCTQIQKQKASAGILVITHYPRILEYLQPDYIHVMKAGQIVLSDEGQNLASKIEREGYASIV